MFGTYPDAHESPSDPAITDQGENKDSSVILPDMPVVLDSATAPSLQAKNEDGMPRGTGEHPSVRATGTDQLNIEPVENSAESPAQMTNAYEPEDERPDQLDRNV
ncbi:MAG TPA: hypothetical protein VJZ27_13905 [Aggregatilineales bacterium]|nr:hypothetical protein [Aggregatilineales bacterium]